MKTIITWILYNKISSLLIIVFIAICIIIAIDYKRDLFHFNNSQANELYANEENLKLYYDSIKHDPSWNKKHVTTIVPNDAATKTHESIGGGSSIAPYEEGRKAYIISKSFVKLYLSSPSSADFDNITAEPQILKTTNSQGDIYIVTYHFDTENDFGKKVRDNYVATLRFKGGDWMDEENWKLLLLFINDIMIHSDLSN